MVRYKAEKEFSLPSEIEHIVQVFEVSEEMPTKKTHYRKWKFNLEEDGEVMQVRMNLFPWEAVKVLQALGYEKDEEGYFDWEVEDVVNKKLKATVFHEEYNGKKYAKLKDFMPLASSTDIPF